MLQTDQLNLRLQVRKCISGFESRLGLSGAGDRIFADCLVWVFSWPRSKKRSRNDCLSKLQLAVETEGQLGAGSDSGPEVGEAPGPDGAHPRHTEFISPPSINPTYMAAHPCSSSNLTQSRCEFGEKGSVRDEKSPLWKCHRCLCHCLTPPHAESDYILFWLLVTRE